MNNKYKDADIAVSTIGAMKDQCGLPFSCVVEPLAGMQSQGERSNNMVLAADVGRCKSCFA